jgi:hypothetical protein
MPHAAANGRLAAVTGSPDEPTDDEIVARLRAASDAQWQAVWDAAGAVADLDAPAHWEGGETVDGVLHLAYPVYDPAVHRLTRALGALSGGLVVFSWPDWEGLARYRTPEAIATAPIADIPRLITAIVRSERFSDGSLEGAIEAGLLAAIVERLRTWRVGAG